MSQKCERAETPKKLSPRTKQKENKERIQYLLLQECGVFKSRFRVHGH
jgi:hypothetical protein